MAMSRYLTAAASLLASSAVSYAADVPAELKSSRFAGPDKTPCPAVLCAAPTGEVYVGVDMQGSLGKKAGHGKIVRLVDVDGDGKVDKTTDFAKIDNPRGLIALGNKLIVLHCNLKDGKPYNQDISVYTDADGDGVADGAPKTIVKGIGNPKYIQSRGADHCTNNIRLGIDGWVYISVGDFGFIDAEGSDGKKLSMHGGGIVRVRPDGSEIETFIHGTRNVYDVAIDPFMNVYTRENTNDGVGWWVRFSHYIQTGEYGYPSLYTNFPEDMLPALAEYGSGSGTGCLYLQEPGWPAKYNNQALLADWGRSKVFIHKVTPNGASFTDEPMDFIGSSQVADLDVDASGRMYVAAWAGAGYTGNKNIGYVDLVVPKNWTFKPFKKLSSRKEAELVTLLKSKSITIRTYASQELIMRKAAGSAKALVALAKDGKNSLETRVAAVYTIAQLQGKAALSTLKDLASDTSLREHAVRCMADRIEVAKAADTAFLTKALSDSNPRVQVAAAVALGRTGNKATAPTLVKLANPPKFDKPTTVKEQGYKSNSVFKGKKTKIKANITGYKSLFLIVDEDGSNGNDHAAWINPTVITKDGKKIDLTTVKWKSAKAGWGKVHVNKDCVGKPLGKGVKGIGTHATSVIEYAIPANAKTFTATGLLTKGSQNKGTVIFKVSPVAPKSLGKSNLHSTPNKDVILPHIATRALLALDAQDAVIAGLNSSDSASQRGALATAKWMHSTKVVDALIAKAKTGSALKMDTINVLLRLQQKENDYDGSTWWKTRPNPHGPYYYPVNWAGSEKISGYITEVLKSASDADKKAIIAEMKRNKAYIAPFNPRPGGPRKTAKTIEKTAIEDVVLFLQKAKGDAKNGAKLIHKVGCAACHNITAKGVIKGPNLAALGNMKKADIAEAIIKPAATIAKSWVTITMQDGSLHVGTLVKRDKKEIVLHNIAGIPTKLDATKVKSEGKGMNMMGPHLCDALTLQEFADLIEYIQSMDPNRKKSK